MDYWHLNFICPYFRRDEELFVGCEGKHKITFVNRDEAKRFMTAYCAGWEWKKCPHAEKINEHYERIHGNGKDIAAGKQRERKPQEGK